MPLQLGRQATEVPLAHQSICQHSLAQVLGKVEQYVPSCMPRRIYMDEGVHLNVNQTSLAKQPREFPTDERINDVLHGIGDEKIEASRPDSITTSLRTVE